MRVRFIGSGDAFGSGGRMQPCFLVETDDGSCLMDCGASSLIALKAASIDPHSIETVLVSHVHGDHYGGLPFLILDGQFRRRTLPLRIVGPPGIRERTLQAMELFFHGSSHTKQKFAIDFVALEDGTPVSVGPFRVTPFDVVHACGAPPFALRVEHEGRIVAYSGDTEWTDRLVDAAAGADLFICESYFYEKRIPYHLTYASLMEHRDELDCKRIILTHMSADMLQHLDDVELETAHDGLQIDL